MEINPLNRIPVTSFDLAPTRAQTPETMASIVTAVRALNKSALMGDSRELLFARDSETQKPVIQITDRNTGEVLQQIPPKEVLRIMADLVRQRQQGLKW